MTETRPCNTMTCPPPIHGGWSTWEDTPTCSATCGSATKQQKRACNNPPPANGGNPCQPVGASTRTVNCKVPKCPPVEVGWSSWGDWSTCWSETGTACSNGTSNRTRSCSDPSPADGGKECEGEDIEFQNCELPCQTAEHQEKGLCQELSLFQLLTYPLLVFLGYPVLRFHP